jgi:hypothetical protein
MFVASLAVLYTLYGILTVVRLWKRGNRRDAIVLIVFSAVVLGYFSPLAGKAIPTPQSLYAPLIKPISESVKSILNIQEEVR